MRRLAVVMGILASVLVASAGAAAPKVGQTSSTPAGSFTTTKTVTRDQVSNGSDVVTDTRTVSLSVSQTTNLEGRQEIGVSWSGAHPTGGIVADPNSADAQNEEYPFVLLECRGTDSASASPSAQLTPQTCWTQTWTEHYQDSFSDQYPPYRMDEYATTADRAAIVGAPSPLPTACKYDETAPVQHWVPFDAANGTVYYGGNAGCAGEPPESSDVTTSGLPSNETFGVTGTDGTGSAEFDVFTTAQNASLGCTYGVPCALVAVPIMGISCDPTGAEPASDVTGCEDTGAFTPGELMPAAGGSQLTVSGSLWWSPSNWRNRITVPLTFAVPAATCDLVKSLPQVDIYGSEMMIQATGQWEPYFCLRDDEPFDFIHSQNPEPESRNLVAAGTAEAAFTSYAQPGGYGRPVVSAPVAVSGFAIAYDIDGANGQPYPDLKLTPLLLAKLLTESYPGDEFMKQYMVSQDPALADNPLNITEDPEFEQLNPGIAKIVNGNTEAASELIALSSDSDVMEALTTYINDDPTARAWLNGAPDQWGMVVNPAYKGISLPVDQWPLLSTYVPTSYYDADGGQLNNCLYNAPVPYQPLVAAPLGTLEDISQSMQYAEPNSTTECSQPDAPSSAGEKLVTAGRQEVGHRFMLGITPLADDQRYQLSAAELQTTPGTYVAPTNASMQAATGLLTPDASTGTWPIPYQAFETSAGAGAYPGTMVIYAAVPTTGLATTVAQNLASFLTFAATAGQTAGTGVGQLPAGYLPLTAADGLGPLASYTQSAAAQVAAQSGQVPPVVPSTGTGDSTPGTTPPPSPPADDSPAALSPAPTPPATHPAVAARRRPPVEMIPGILSLGRTPDVTLWTGGFPFLVLFGLALLMLLAVPTTYRVGRRRGRW